MVQEDKQLLFKDLCARLPYGVRCKVWIKDGTTEEGSLDLQHNYGDVLRDAFYYNKIVNLKPYLRPMSSMSEEEFVEFRNTWEVLEHRPDVTALSTASYDWLNANHFDYRKLIEKSLAIEVTEDNNPYKD